MKRLPVFASLLLAQVSFGLSNLAAFAEEVDPRVPSRAIYQSMLDLNKDKGWIAFRNYDGKQYAYFSTLQTQHCRLSEIRYSINSRDLDQRFDVVDCNPQNPFAMPPDFKPEDILINAPLGTMKTIAVQVVWKNGDVSGIGDYKPCDNVGEQSCAAPAAE